MKQGKILDTDVAIKVLGLKVADFDSVPNFSTNVSDSYIVINKLQTMGWACNVQSHVSQSGHLTYTVRFTKNNLESSYRADSIPMAVCAAAIAVVDEKYFEHTEKKTKSSKKPEAEIIQMNKFDQSEKKLKTDDEANTILNKIIDAIDSAEFKALGGGKFDMVKILRLMKQTKRFPDDLEQDFSHQLARIILDKLAESGYSIYRESED